MSAQMIILFNTHTTGNLNDNEVIVSCSPKNEINVQELIKKLNHIQDLEEDVKDLDERILGLDAYNRELSQEIHDLKGKITALQLREELAKKYQEDLGYLIDAVVDCRLAVIRADEIVKKYEIKL